VSDAKASSDTPLSDLIAAHIANDSPESWNQFLDGFRKSQVGVVASGVPAGAVGEFVSTVDQPLSVGITLHAGGRPMVLAFADPKAFSVRFGRSFNAALVGEALLATALLNPECAGVLVNSALAEVSVVIDRATAEAMVRPSCGQTDAKPWWGFW
jgi:SseB protein N-terminal domain